MADVRNQAGCKNVRNQEKWEMADVRNQAGVRNQEM